MWLFWISIDLMAFFNITNGGNNTLQYCKAWQHTYSILYSIGMDAVLRFIFEIYIWRFWFFRFICDIWVSWALPHKLLICGTEMWDHNLNKEKTQNITHLSLGPSFALILWYFDDWVFVCVFMRSSIYCRLVLCNSMLYH